MPWAERMPSSICAKCRNFDKVVNPVEDSDLFICTNRACGSVFCSACLGAAPYCFRCGHLMDRVESEADGDSDGEDSDELTLPDLDADGEPADGKAKPCILVVDDEPNILQLFKEVMPGLGFRVLVAESAEAGLKLANEFTPDVIISDIMMPRIDGYEFLRRVRSNPRISAIPFVALTGKTQDKDIFEGWKRGVDSYITKPFDLENLVQEITKLVGG